MDTACSTLSVFGLAVSIEVEPMDFSPSIGVNSQSAVKTIKRRIAHQYFLNGSSASETAYRGATGLNVTFIGLVRV